MTSKKRVMTAIAGKKHDKISLWALQMAAVDNVATLIEDAAACKSVTIEAKDGRMIKEMTLRNSISRGHKIALNDIPAGHDIIKYGEVIGRATNPVAAGEWVHVHNIESLRGRGDRNA